MKITNLDFPISSEQLKLLYCLENSSTLEQLSNMLHKEKSVISKNLKRLHLDFPSLITKKNRRWEVSELGIKVNKVSERFSKELAGFLPSNYEVNKDMLYNNQNSVLMIMNPQKVFEDDIFGVKSNPEAMKNIRSLVDKWRANGKRIIFVRHLSENPESPLHISSEQSYFMESIQPLEDELVIEKSISTAFGDVDFDTEVSIEEWSSLVIVGFTAAECIDATARDSHKLEIPTFVVADAVSTSNLVGPNGELFHSKLVLGITLANLHSKVATILETQAILNE
jgi:nicotinamidase-related amidase